MKLKVLAGAKQGTEIPLKKRKFVIGRASDCTLRAGSEAISRHHCVVLRLDSGVAIRDLGSRNGTFVNDEKIAKQTSLANGDRVRVGPLEFIFEGVGELANEKKPKVKDVADAVERTAQSSDVHSIEEDDISKWLLSSGSQTPKQIQDAAMHETQAMQMDETQALPRISESQTIDGIEGLEAEAEAGLAGEEDAAQSPDEAAEEPAPGKKKGKGKKEFGKLPDRPQKPQSKDSREAAADILRELSRRR